MLLVNGIIMTKCQTSIHHRRSCHHHHHQQQQHQQQQPAEEKAVGGDEGAAAAGRGKSLARIIDRFGRQTSMHGVPNAIRARSMTGRVFWCVVCVVAASTFAFQLTQLLWKYFSYPRKVVIEVLPLAAPFPSISLCNMRNLDTIVLNRLNRIFLRTNDIGEMLRQFSEDLPPPYNTTASPPGGDDDALGADENYTQPLYRRRRSSRKNRDSEAAVKRDEWIRLMKSVLWKKPQRRKTEAGFRTRRSPSSSCSSSSSSSLSF